ncbi:MAG: NADH-quinone oxidoreductase subunit J [Parvularculales bacterium]
MIIYELAFYVFSTVVVGSGFMVIAARNPVHSVLFLIMAFFSAAGLFILAGAEFLAFILIVVYVGAVAVLFLFVVMMLDVDFAKLKRGFLQYLPTGSLVGIILLVELVLVLGSWGVRPETLSGIATPVPEPATLTNTEAIGAILYTNYIYFFQAAGLILLVAMIGAITLTLRHRDRVRRQVIYEQVARKPKEAVALKNIKPGDGV